MARLRTIKPGFFLDDELAECQPLARLLFAGLWTVADREGRLRDRPRKIKAETLPYDDCDVNELLHDLATHGSPARFIIRYSVEECPYIAIPAWDKHQSPHIKEVPSTIPAPDKYQTSMATAPYEPPSSCLVSCLVSGNHKELLSDSGESNDIESTPSDTSPDDFDLFWTSYPRKESKKAAQSRWRRVAKKDRAAAVAAAEAMAECVTRGWQEKTFCPHPSTFLNQRRWEDWADGPPANYLPDQSTTGNLTDVLDAGAQAFGLIGDEHDQLGTAEDDGTEGTLTGSQDARRRLPACELAAGQ